MVKLVNQIRMGVYDLIFTHRYNTSNTDVKILQNQWCKLTGYFITKASTFKIKYWPGDLDLQNKKDYLASTYGIKLLQNYAIDKVLKDGMEELTVSVNNRTKEIILNNNENKYHELISAWFHLEILDDNNNTVFYSADFGSDILMKLSGDIIPYLVQSGINANRFIKLPENHS